MYSVRHFFTFFSSVLRNKGITQPRLLDGRFDFSLAILPGCLDHLADSSRRSTADRGCFFVHVT